MYDTPNTRQIDLIDLIQQEASSGLYKDSQKVC